SISGLHITMIAGLFGAMVHWLWRRSFFTGAQLPLRMPAQKAAALTAAITAFLYVLLAGFGVPAQRTLYMLWVVAAALWLGRLGSVSHVLSLAALAVVVLDPWAVLWPGFWLSFGAVAIILYASVGRGSGQADALTRARRWSAQLRAAAHGQYVVTVGLVPLTLLLFGQVSLVSPVANAIAIPLVSLVVTPLALAGSLLPAPLSVLLLSVAHGLVAWLALLLTWLSTLPWAVWSAPLPAAWIFVCALVGALWLLAPRGWPARWLGLVGWVPILCNAPVHPMPGRMTVTAFDVGQGMALLVETAGHRLLYDTGPSYSPESDGGNRVLVPYLKARGIDWLDGVIVTHNDNDHSGGALSVFRQIGIGWVLSSLAPASPIVKAAPGHRRCEAGQRWTWDGFDFEMLQPGAASYESEKWKPNARSCTLKITPRAAPIIGGSTVAPAPSILLAGDIEAIQEDELVGKFGDRLRATVLLAPHHGSGTSSTLPFLLAVRPQVAVFQVGYRNRYHHPKPEVLERYRELGIERLRNDDSGAITLQFGSSLSIRTYRSDHRRYWYDR
ncbi:MAG: DNA internalization-related competence protein ComEC/Rec2, partial [Herminiimonas sp.]|nr:DNA internalization-related competence protein ComEC/Rec2 [Herminiimonas sp.]